MASETIQQVNIEDEMRASYLDYAMSVIIGRALPDVRDGLKPVHRRILYAMYTEGLLHNRKYSKCAGVVGEVLKKYHPHGDAAVYDSLVRMAQEWNMRMPLVDGQGNFGSIDGDPAAAYRYTESRMEKLAEELLSDIEKQTVDFTPNFDGSTDEPSILPTRFPNMLVNGSTGIAVGMATNIPPHNLHEVIDAAVFFVRNPGCSIDDLMQIVPGPDFPTGGIIYGRAGIKQAYRTGRGIIYTRGEAMIEVSPKTGKSTIIITEIPFQVNKAKMVERIANLVRDKKIQGISDVRDESDRDGMRVVVELRRDAVAQVILNQLYKQTQLHSSFGIIMLAIVGGQPKLLNLRQMLEYFIAHRREVIRRRCVYELEQARARAHILEGLQIALDNIDEVIQIIRSSKEPPIAKHRLIERFSLSQRQAQAILDMRLQRLTGLERDKILSELAQLRQEIERLTGILEDVEKLMDLVVAELEEVKEEYKDQRRTRIVDNADEITIEDLIADEDQVVTISHTGYIKRNPLTLYRTQRRGGKGRTGMKARTEDFVEDVFVASAHTSILVVTQNGKAYALKVHEVPEAGPAAKGTAIVNLVRIHADEQIASLVPVRSFDEQNDQFLVMVSQQGYCKKTALSAFANINVAGIIAMSVDQDDKIISASLTSGQQEIMISTRMGMSVRFREPDVRPMGRQARGVRGVRLRKEDRVVSMEVVSPGATILTVTENGYGKRTELDEYRLTSRGGVGVKTCRVTDRNGPVVGCMQINTDDDLMLITDGGMVIRMQVSGISLMGRDTQGVRLIDLKDGERVVGLARLIERDSDEPDETDEPVGSLEEATSDMQASAEPSQTPQDTADEDEGDPDESG